MKYFVANWKMYLGPRQASDLAAEYAAISVPDSVCAIVCPSALSFEKVANTLSATNWRMGAQNSAWASVGAYTGAISAQFYQEAGAEFILIGHSERRHIFGETDTDIRKKIEAVLAENITPVLCVGETAEDLSAGKRQYRLKKQLYSALHDLSSADRVIIAYEPVWAIQGNNASGSPCLPTDVADVHGWITDEVVQYGLNEPVILYGGSVTHENAKSYLDVPTVGGILVGSASTHAANVKKILADLA
jgi:triosephosphate isomerase